MTMKDAVMALVEAVRVARLEIECYRDPRCRASAVWTVNRLDELLTDKAVSEAMQVLAPDAESPSIIPDSAVKARQFLQS
jgi:hypothetical protein